jgi:hypothetical protein
MQIFMCNPFIRQRYFKIVFQITKLVLRRIPILCAQPRGHLPHDLVRFVAMLRKQLARAKIQRLRILAVRHDLSVDKHVKCRAFQRCAAESGRDACVADSDGGAFSALTAIRSSLHADFHYPHGRLRGAF